MAPIRAEVMAQPAAERIDYALALLEFYLDPLPPFIEGCARLGLDLHPMDLRMLHLLDRRRGKYVTCDALGAVRDPDQGADGASYDYTIKRLGVIRGQLAGAGLPVEIVTLRHLGYCLRGPDDFRFEAAA